MYDYYDGKCAVTGENMTIGLDKIDVTTIKDRDTFYMYGNIECAYSKENCLNCEDCSIVDENGVKRFERFKGSPRF